MSIIWCTIGVSGIEALDSSALDVDPQDLGVGLDGHPGLHRLLAHDRAGAQRVDHAGAGGEEPAEEQLLVDVGHELLDLVRSDQLDRLDPPGLGRGHPPGQLLHPLRCARDLDPAALDEHVEVLVLAHALERQRGHLLGVVDGEDEVRRVPG
jgi:hypothetical protein